MDHIDEYLTTESLNASRPAAIRESLNTAKKLLNKYYAKTDNSELYRVAMGA